VSDRKLNAKPKGINKLNRHITIGQIDIDNDGIIGREELETFVAFYNSFVDDFQMQKRLLYFLCLAVLVSWAIIIGVLIPLNFLAVELNNNDSYQVVDSNGNALGIRQSVGVASTFSCTHDYLAQLQYLFITDLHKEQVLSVEVVPRDAEDPTQSPFSELALVTTATGVYQIPCTTTKKRDHGDDNNHNCAGVRWNTSPNCGNRHVDKDEECDASDNCDENCLCGRGHTPKHGNCVSLCGNGKIDGREDCDGSTGCDHSCNCKFGYTPLYNTTGFNGTIISAATVSTISTGCVPVSPCSFKGDDYPCGLFQSCHWDGVTANAGVTCTCAAGYTGVTTHFGFVFCVDVDECSFGTNPCPNPKRCFNIPGTYYCR